MTIEMVDRLVHTEAGPVSTAIGGSGPDLILRASRQVDLYDGELAEHGLGRPWRYGIRMSPADEKIVLPAEPGAKYFIMVRSFSGEGNYPLTVENA